MFKNTAGQKITLLVIDTANNVPKTGDAANLTFYVQKDDDTVDALADTSASEVSATNAPGLYTADLAQAETNGDKLLFSGKSSTANIRVVPVQLWTTPNLHTFVSDTDDALLDLSAKLPDELTTDGLMKSDILRINGNSDAAIKLALGGRALAWFTVGASPTTTAIPTDLGETDNDFWNGRVMTPVTGGSAGQTRAIADYDGSTKVITVAAMNPAVAEGDIVVIS